MSRPTKGTVQQGTVQQLKRLARYIRGCPRCVLKFRWQTDPQSFCTYVDSDWAGCTKTRRSTSGGVCMRGQHPIRFWSRTQASVALSSGEAELTSIVKGSTEALGLSGMAKELGMGTHRNHLFTDSSAANGAVHRQGAGRIKHVCTSVHWVQEQSARGKIVYKKIGREANCSDLLTHHWTTATGAQHLERMGMKVLNVTGTAEPLAQI